ncbi:PREDICTED: histone-lysine N-methyltransferase, H3 lysine-9 specific SUVH4 isoform X2 [Tarenaya hassleriana]|uniref:histone-lysine N-methyltransferase, H3 lysine-9 specific SUVH4 isoform X2 n=1 Tax=Tarenaya hassleriana TaxID=28532 RepID=UPI00053C33FF|nr:PREDICTED: histone-lysine N-methyltransferase, H3 lysine-9 specific SUVH4 isoform X2 [Tarenaya hassleriana]
MVAKRKREKGEGDTERRASLRIQDKLKAQKEAKEKLVLERVKLLDDDSASRGNSPESSAPRRSVSSPAKETKTTHTVSHGDGGQTDSNGSSEHIEKAAHLKVRETLRLFNKHYLHFVQEEEKRCAKHEKIVVASKSKGKRGRRKGTKNKAASDEDAPKARRPDLKALTKMKDANEILYPEKRIGNLPGIEEYSHYTLPLAVSIVISGMYEDDLDNADEVVYTGQGGQNLTGNKRQIQDQTLTRGNLALKNCIEHNVPVRVIRGHQCTNSYTRRVYTYDGLYKVVRYWAEKGISGYTVYKYKLKRLEGQPVLMTNQVNFVFGRVPQSISEIQGLVCKDITGGLETIPVPATNRVDDPPVAPTGFTYINSLKVESNMKIPRNASGCNCLDECSDPRECACAKFNGGDFPYVKLNDGRLVEPRDVIFECGPDCGCGPGCVNRTSQKGLRFHLEVFRSPKKGWGVRSWDYIPAGSPVCEYLGVLRRTDDVDSVSDNNYIFEIDCLQTMQGLGGRERRLRDVSIPMVNKIIQRSEDQNAPEFCIDAGSKGNISRFINHSCEPNLFVQCVLSSHHDLKLARVVLFAADNIPPLQELTYDYGYEIDSVYGPDGKVKQLACYCGATACRKRLY